MIALLAIAAAAGAAEGAACSFLVDDVPVTSLDCEAGGAWKVKCALPTGPSGKLRVHLSTLGIDAEARLPLSEKAEVVLPLGGPGGRAGAFLVDRAVAGLVPGQAVGPNQLCPFVQPDVRPGSARVERPLTVTVTAHQQTGFAEEPLDGGVINRVPTYDRGQTVATGTLQALQRRVGDVPILTGTTGLPRDEALEGRLQLRDGAAAWHTLEWSGRVAEVSLDASVLNVLVLDLVAAEIGAATGADPVAWVEDDLRRWLAGDPSSLLGVVAFAKSGLHVPLEGSFEDAVLDGQSWRRLSTGRADVRVGRRADRVRVAIGWQGAPLGDAARAALETAIGADLSGVADQP